MVSHHPAFRFRQGPERREEATLQGIGQKRFEVVALPPFSHVAHRGPRAAAPLRQAVIVMARHACIPRMACNGVDLAARGKSRSY